MTDYRRWMKNEDGGIDIPEDYTPSDYVTRIDERGERYLDFENDREEPADEHSR